MNHRSQTIKLARRHWQMYLLLLLPVVYLLVFRYYPMLGAQIAFRRFRASQGIWGSQWVGFANFVKFFKSYQFNRVFSNTLLLSVYQLIAGFPLPIILALLLNAVTAPRYKKIVQTVTYLPYFISVVVLVGMMMQVFNPIVGLYGKLSLALLGIHGNDFFGNARYFSHLYVWSGVWQNMGWNSIIYLAALSTVSPELHEAGKIDGMSKLRRIIHIDLPAILPTITVLLTLNAGRIMSLGFEKVYLMQNSLNISRSEVISTYVYKVGLASGGGDFSYATAIGLFNSVINLALLVLVNKICKKTGGSGLW